MDARKILYKQVEKLMADAAYVVVASNAEKFFLWKEWHSRVKWKSFQTGTVVALKKVAGVPFSISVVPVVIEGQMVAFVDGMGPLIDMRQIDDWVTRNAPSKPDGSRCTSNAMQFQDVIDHIAVLNVVRPTPLVETMPATIEVNYSPAAVS